MAEKTTLLWKNGQAYLHIKQAAKLLGCSEQFVRAKCASGELLGQVVAGAWHIEQSSLEFHKREHILGSARRESALREQAAQDLASVTQKRTNALRIVGTEIRGVRK